MPFLEWIHCIVPFAAGSVTGLFFHGALWWTVRALPRSRAPVVLSIGSFYLRMTITLASFYMVMQNDWRRLAVCLAGFMAVRFIMTRKIGRAAAGAMQ